MSAATVLGLVAAGVVAGVVGTAGGITSLVSYPALLAAGLAPLPADVVNLVALVACWPSSALASRRELRGTSRLLALVLPAAAAGAAVGSLLLLVTPPGAFTRVVPWLVLAGSVALLAQPAITARRGAPAALGDRRPRRALLPWIAALSVYGGYFGAGSGIMLLAALLVFEDARLPHANAVKNMLVGACAICSAAVFVATGRIDWAAAAPLAAGLLLGGFVGPRVVRRLPARAVRWGAAVLGVALAVELWVHPG